MSTIPAHRVLQLLDAIETAMKRSSDDMPTWIKLNEAKATVIVYLVNHLQPVELKVTP